MTREARLAQTMVELADNLVDDFDVVDVLTVLVGRCVEILDASAAGIILLTPAGEPRVVASSSEAMRLLELFELQAAEGPCFDTLHSGRPTLDGHLDEASGRWPAFTVQALAAGFRHASALPMQLRGTVIGALNLFRTTPGAMAPSDVPVAQAFADIATIAILQHRATADALRLSEHLTIALESRIVIEQAKGVLAERAGLDMSASFDRLRSHARNHNLRLADVARSVVEGELGQDGLDPPS